MRILHLTTFLQGGAGRAITDLACEQQRAGHDVGVVSSHTAPAGYGNYPAYLEELRDGGVDLHLVDSMFSRELADNLNVCTYIRERELLCGVSVVHAHAATPAFVALASRGAGCHRVPIVQTMHGWGMRKTAAQQQADVAIMNTVERLVVPARSSADVLHAAGVTRPDIAVVPYGVRDVGPGAPPADLSAAMMTMRAEGRTIFTCVGTIGTRKNQALIVDAIARTADPSRVMCLFVGDGESASLQAYADRLGVGASVGMLGYRADASRVAQASDWFILPSRSEGQPLAVLEAFRDGVPVLVSRIPELAELVEAGDSGLLFESDDAGALAKRLVEAAEMPRAATAAMAARARARFDAGFTLQEMVRGYANEYTAALASIGSQAAGAAA